MWPHTLLSPWQLGSPKDGTCSWSDCPVRGLPGVRCLDERKGDQGKVRCWRECWESGSVDTAWEGPSASTDSSSQDPKLSVLCLLLPSLYLPIPQSRSNLISCFALKCYLLLSAFKAHSTKHILAMCWPLSWAWPATWEGGVGPGPTHKP